MIFFEILKIILPAIIVLITAYLAMKAFFDNEANKRRIDMKTSNQKLITPIRLGAYERLVLFLERIQPDTLIVRSLHKGMTARELQSDLLALIRAEYEHNMSQQIYISNQSWEVIKSAKENTVKIINTAATKVPPNAPALDLSRAILESIMEINKTPSVVAIEYLKNEITTFL